MHDLVGDPPVAQYLFKPHIGRHGGPLAAIPDLVNREVAENGLQAVQVIRMRMGEHHNIQVADPA